MSRTARAERLPGVTTADAARPRPGETLIVFDCDGVVVDSEPLLQRVLIELVTELGWPLTTAEIQREFLGRSNADTVAIIERRLGRPVPADFIERLRAMRRELFARELTAVPGAVDAIAELERAGYRTCIASSAVHDTLRVTLGKVGLYERFAGRIFSAQDVARGKPAPDLFLHAAAAMGFAPGNCVVVEDSPAGIRAARAARMTSIGFAAATPRELLAEADAVIDDLAELVGFVGAIAQAASGLRREG